MICPDNRTECDNPGCRRGGCQGRLPTLPLFRSLPPPPPAMLRPIDPLSLDRPGPMAG